MPNRLLLLIVWMIAAPAVASEKPPLIDKPAANISSEASGTAAKRTVQSLSVHHRMRGSQGYKMAAELIRGLHDGGN